MIYNIQSISSDDGQKVIEFTKESLIDAKKASTENLYWQTQSLAEVRQKAGDHQQGIEALKGDIAKINSSIVDVEHKIDRIDMIHYQSQTQFFVIEANTDLEDIKALLSAIIKQKKGASNPVQTRFLESIEIIAETCKEYKSQKQEFLKQYIPLLNSEIKYYDELVVELTHMKLDSLIKKKSD